MNEEKTVIKNFGEEWQKFDQSKLNNKDAEAIFNKYFALFPWHLLPKQSVGFDLGCGSGRWALLVAPRVGLLHCIDPSSAVNIAQKNLKNLPNCIVHQAGVDNIPLPDNSADFGYSLGVLHHVPDTAEGIKKCVMKLKKGAPFLIYLYYSFENRPVWFRYIWLCSELGRRCISRLPFVLKNIVCQLIAITIYYPLSRFAGLFEKIGFSVDSFPLSAYRDKGLYVLQTDALDRFGTKLEQRFSQKEIHKMLKDAGLEKIIFNDHAPYWCAVGIKK